MTRVSSYVMASLCFISIASFVIHQSSKAQSIVAQTKNHNHPTLGFQSFKGTYTTDDQVQSFLNFINSASSFFEDDTKERLNYISYEMNKTYGIGYYGVSVIQQTKEGINDWTFTDHTGVYAALASGVDRIFPKYSYMFLIEPFTSPRVFISTVGQKGIGITDKLESSIFSAIMDAQTGDTCKCEYYSSRIISEQIEGFNGGTWSTFCSSDPDTFIAYVYSRYNRYIFTKPKNCYYIIYDNNY